MFFRRRGHDGGEDGVAHGPAGAPERTDQAGADAELLDGDEQAGGDVGQRRHPGEAALAKEQQGGPGRLVVGDHGGVGTREGALDAQGKDDLVADVLDDVDQTREDPAAEDARHGGGDQDDTDLERIAGEHVERGLRGQGHDGLPDHARDEEDDEVDGKLAEHGEQFKREDGVFRNREIVDERADEDDGTDADGGRDDRDRVVLVAEVGHAHEEDGEAGREEEETDKVEFLEFLPAGLFIIMLWAGRGEIKDHGTGDADAGVDDGDVITPAPGSVDKK